MDLNEIVVFAKVVEAGSFTAAAAALGLPKSSVSRKLAQLEERLGARLLQRTTRKLALTEVGTAYYERCRAIVADIADAEQSVADMQSSPRGLLRVTAPIDVGGVLLGGVVAKLLITHPDLQVELIATDRVVDLVEERVDVGLRFGPLPDSSLVARRVGRTCIVPYASPGYIARKGSPKRPDDLVDHDIIMFAPIARMRTWTFRGKPARGGRDGEVTVTPTPRLLATSMFAALDAVRSGAGIAVLGDFVARDDLAAGRLVRVLEGWSGTSAELFAVYPSTRNPTPKMKIFLDAVQGLLG